MTLTPAQLKEIIPSNRYYENWCIVLNQELPKFEVNTPLRLAGFLAQCGHESLDFTILSENLNYSSDALMRVFPKYFKDCDPTLYHRNPEKIANRVYANRMGNGDEDSGDGWRYRGRGLIQLTGTENYKKASKFLYSDDTAIDGPDVFATNSGAVQSACWFWVTNNCNEIADSGDNEKLTRRINGGTHGLEDRQQRYKRAMVIL